MSARRGGVVCRSVAIALVTALAGSMAGGQRAAHAEVAFTDLRHVYERGGPCTLHVNAAGADTVGFDVSGWLPHSAEVNDEAAEYRIDTNLLRAGDYTVRATELVAGKTAEGKVAAP